MTSTPAVLLQTKYLETAETTQYGPAPSTAKVVYVDSFIVSNRGGAGVTLIVRVVPSGGTPGVEHELFPTKTLAVGEVYEVPPFKLGPGDFIRTIVGTATSLVARIDGRIIT